MMPSLCVSSRHAGMPAATKNCSDAASIQRKKIRIEDDLRRIAIAEFDGDLEGMHECHRSMDAAERIVMWS